MGIENVAGWQTTSLNQLGNAANDNTVQGSFNGMSVSVVADDAATDLADSCEELTFGKDNDHETKLADRKQKSGLDKNDYVERLKKVFRREDEQLKQEQTNKLVTFLKQGAKSRDDIEKFLKDLVDLSSGSYASAYAFLKTLSENDQDDDELKLDPEQKALVKQAADLLYAQNKTQVDAQCNALDVIEDTDYATAFDLSKFYGNLATGEKDELSVVNELSKMCGEDHLSDGIELMFKALASDLASASRSNEVNILNDVASTLTRAMSVNSGLAQTSSFVNYVKDELGIVGHKLNNSELLINTLRLSRQAFISPSAVHDLFKSKVPVKDPEQAVLVGQSFFKMLRQTSPNLYVSGDDRMKLISAAQQLLDQLIDAEDEWLDSLDN